MQKPYRIQIFGKPDCPMCELLHANVDRLLADESWADVDQESIDLGTIPGLVEFADAECLNPQRVPALRVLRRDARGVYQAIPLQRPVLDDPVCGKSRLYGVLGLQADYTHAGGRISPEMIAHVVDEARERFEAGG